VTIAEPIAWMLFGIFIHNTIIITATVVAIGCQAAKEHSE
jgi:hypothetical protein